MRLHLAGQDIVINMATRARLIDEIRRRFRARAGFSLATVNLDHLVKMRGDPGFAAIYGAQDLIVADGNPVVWLSRIAGQGVELIPGSELVEPLSLLAAEEQVPVALVGSHRAALEDAADALRKVAPGIDIVLCIPPSQDFDPKGDEADAIIAELAEARVGLCFLALGAPKQEVFAAHARDGAPMVGFALIGAGLDFLGGHQRRAPKWMRRFALEWLWRAMSSPRRLLPRYIKCAAILPGLFLQALRARG